MKDRVSISRAPGSDIKVEVYNPAIPNPTFSFVLTHIPTGIQVKGEGKQRAATETKLREKLAEAVAEHERKQEHRVPLSTADLRPLRALADKLQGVLNLIATVADSEPTVSQLNEISTLAAVVSAELKAKVAVVEAGNELASFP